MGQLVDPCGGRYSLRSGTIVILTWFLIIEIIHLSIGVYNFLWEVSESSSSPVILSILLVKYVICIFAIVFAFFGLCVKKSVFLIPALLTRVVTLFGDLVDLTWYILKEQTIIPTSLQLLYTEHYFIEIVFGALFLVLSCYCIVVIHSYYHELKKDDSEATKLPEKS